MLSYTRQIALCESVRETVKQALVESNQLSTKLKAGSIPTTDSILRAVSLFPAINTDEELKEFIIKHIIADLRLTEDEMEQLNLINHT